MTTCGGGAGIQFVNHRHFPPAQTRNMESLPADVVKAIELVTLDPAYPPQIVGSFKYVVHEYPADIDLFEPVRGCCTADDVARKVVNRLQDMVNKLVKLPNTYLADFKAGTDRRYELDIGKLTGATLSRYSPDRIRSAIRKLHAEGLLSDGEVSEWLKAVLNRPTLQDFLDLKGLVHDKQAVRWTAKEMLKGHKTLPNKVKLTLAEALTQKSIVKIDVWVLINGRFVELTNWYHIELTGNRTEALTQPLGNYSESLMKDIEYYSNPELGKYMKLAKRIWNHAVLRNQRALMVALYPLFSSGAAKMYQIMGEMETIAKLLRKYGNKVDMPTVRMNIEEWKARLGTVMVDTLPTKTAMRCYKKIDAVLKTRSREMAITLIYDLHEMLEYWVDKAVKKYVKRKRIMSLFSH